jgi:hypothetical protein
VFRRYLRAATAVVAARGATMLAGPRLHADGRIRRRRARSIAACGIPVATCDAATMFRLNLATIRHDPAVGLDGAESDELAAALAARGRDTAVGRITWLVRAGGHRRLSATWHRISCEEWGAPSPWCLDVSEYRRRGRSSPLS